MSFYDYEIIFTDKENAENDVKKVVEKWKK